jgi:membrane-associated protease RseP (regulator of RpoE activity)
MAYVGQAVNYKRADGETRLAFVVFVDGSRVDLAYLTDAREDSVHGYPAVRYAQMVAEDATGATANTFAETATHVDGAAAAVVANDATTGGIPVVHIVEVADGATADIDVVLDHKTEVLDVIVRKRGGAGGASDTITVKNAANAISNAIDINIADNVIARASSLDGANNVINAAGTLRVTRTKASGANVACRVTVLGVRRA